MKRGSPQLDLVERGAERRDGRRPSRASGTRPRPAAGSRACRARRRAPRRASKCVAVAREHDLAGRVVVGDGQARRPRRPARPRPRRRRPARSSSRGRRPRPSAGRAARRARARRRPSSTPAAASAASSPSEWPAAAAGATSSARPRQPAIEAQKIAGCWKRVLSSTRAKGSSPTSSMAALEQLGAALGDEVAHLGRLAPLAGEQQRDGAHARNTLIAARVNSGSAGLAYPPAGGVLGAGCRVATVAREDDEQPLPIGVNAGQRIPSRRHPAQRAARRAARARGARGRAPRRARARGRRHARRRLGRDDGGARAARADPCFDLVVGASAGAINGAALLAGVARHGAARLLAGRSPRARSSTRRGCCAASR